MSVFTQALIDWVHLALAALGVGFLLFEAGLVSLGHAGLLLATSYTVAMAATGRVSAAMAALILASAWGLLSALALRLQGPVFAVASFALAECLRLGVIGARDYTDGTLGLGPIDIGAASATDGRAAALGLVALVVVTVAYVMIVGGVPGLIAGATRDHELLAQSAGIRTQFTRMVCVAASVVPIAVVGVLEIGYYHLATPEAGAIDRSLQWLAAGLLAAPLWRHGKPLRTAAGVVAGAALLVAFPIVLRRCFTGAVDVALLRQALFGIALYVLVHPAFPLWRKARRTW
ncbi:MAG: hypothetical protein K8T90_19265 [Planctomycetes bacterium]|nr:hypothetical protein [Planctomycetota bacterium]